MPRRIQTGMAGLSVNRVLGAMHSKRRPRFAQPGPPSEPPPFDDFSGSGAPDQLKWDVLGPGAGEVTQENGLLIGSNEHSETITVEAFDVAEGLEVSLKVVDMSDHVYGPYVYIILYPADLGGGGSEIGVNWNLNPGEYYIDAIPSDGPRPEVYGLELPVWIGMKVTAPGVVTYRYSTDGVIYTDIGMDSSGQPAATRISIEMQPIFGTNKVDDFRVTRP